MDNYFKNRMDGRERLAVMEVGMLPDFYDGIFAHIPEERMSRVPGLKRDLKCCRALCDKAYRGLIATAPEGTAEMIRTQVRGYEWRVERKSPIDPPASQYVPMADIHMLIDSLFEHECSLCMRTGNDAKLCQYRKMLRKYVDEPEPAFAGDCGYTGAKLSDKYKGGKR